MFEGLSKITLSLQISIKLWKVPVLFGKSDKKIFHIQLNLTLFQLAYYNIIVTTKTICYIKQIYHNTEDNFIMPSKLFFYTNLNSQRQDLFSVQWFCYRWVLRPSRIKNPQRRKIICGIHPIGRKDHWSIWRCFSRISYLCDFCGCSCGCC